VLRGPFLTTWCDSTIFESLSSSRRPHTMSVSAFLLHRSSDLGIPAEPDRKSGSAGFRDYAPNAYSRSEERFSRFPRLCAKCLLKIGRASCRERVKLELIAGAERKNWREPTGTTPARRERRDVAMPPRAEAPQ